MIAGTSLTNQTGASLENLIDDGSEVKRCVRQRVAGPSETRRPAMLESSSHGDPDDECPESHRHPEDVEWQRRDDERRQGRSPSIAGDYFFHDLPEWGDQSQRADCERV